MEFVFEWIYQQSVNEAFTANIVSSLTRHVPRAMNETEPVQCNGSSEAIPLGEKYTVFQTVLIAIVLAILSIVTIIGNVLVVVAFKMDRRLQTVSNYFLLSLAVADFFIGSVSMPLMTAYTLVGWTLGPIVCDAWLTLDYTCSNASVLNVFMISVDRYLSVTNPLKYRAKRTARRAAYGIAFAWAASLVLWAPPIIGWQFYEGRRTVPYNMCYIQFLESDTTITIVTCLAAFYCPVIVMFFLSYKVWRATENRKQYLAEMIAENEQSTERPRSCLPGQPALSEEVCRTFTQRLKDFLIKLCNVDCDEGNEDEGNSPGGTTPSSAETPIQSSRATSVTLRPEQIVYLQSLLNQDEEMNKKPAGKESIYTVMIHLPDPSDPDDESSHPRVTMIPDEGATPSPLRSSLSTGALMGSVGDHSLQRCKSNEVLSAYRLNTDAKTAARLQRPVLKKRNNKVQEKKHDRKAARTLSAILLAFIVTWTPYNVLVLVKSVEKFVSCSDIIPQGLWDFSYFLCYLNSMINPLCYALANANFRKTYWRILTCTWRQKSKLSIIRGLHSKAS